MPRDAYGRARVRAWLRYIEEVPTAAIRVPSFNGLFLKGWRQMSDAMRARYIEATPLRKGHYRRFGTDGFSKDQMDESTERLRQTVERIDGAVAKARVAGGRRDLARRLVRLCRQSCACRTSASKTSGATCPNMTDWYARIRARPSFDKAFYPGARVSVAD